MAQDSVLKFDDLWQPTQPLPGPDVLQAVAWRCGKAWGVPLLHRRVRIAYNDRMRSALGRAHLREETVCLNLRLLQQDPQQLLPTLVHELAHVAVHLVHGPVAPHGREFRRLMAIAGMPASARMHVAAGDLRRRRADYLYLHRCGKCGYSFLARRVRRDCYCKACGPEMDWIVHRAPASEAGMEALKQLQAGQPPGAAGSACQDEP